MPGLDLLHCTFLRPLQLGLEEDGGDWRPHLAVPRVPLVPPQLGVDHAGVQAEVEGYFTMNMCDSKDFEFPRKI